MDIESIREHCLGLRKVTEDMPFGPDTLVFRIYNKIFACLDLTRPDRIALKCDPERAIELRERYRGIEGAWHWNKRFWNDVYLESDVPDALIRELVEHSLHEVLRKLPVRVQREYAAAGNEKP
ncbi:MAG: MmcQ/YjbR family DNA-binding protein [Bacteroidaceae bacterium]|nr:MmcQ/YjbR family DNA-binding protein [Bacteroidaceae bacterium]